MNAVIIIAIVAAVLIGSGLFYFIGKKIGYTFVNAAYAIVLAVKTALEDTNLASSRVTTVLDLIVQALSYAQAICDSSATTAEKVEKALAYIQNIAGQLSITISADEITIITNVLEIGFTVMGALGVTAGSYKKLYSRMAKYAGTSANVKAIGLKNIAQ
jgi:hypothetical protein